MSNGAILVVEDDPTIVHAITRNLAARGYESRSATTVAEATTALREGTPSLMLLDVDLPDGSGWEVLRELRAAGHTDVAVIVMSALRPNPRLCEEMDTVGVLEKPFPMESLLRLVAQSTGRPAESTPAEDGSGGGRDA